MSSVIIRLQTVLFASVVMLASVGASPAAAQAPLAGVAEALGRPGADQPGGVVRFGFPRSDLTVVAGGVTLKPALALGSWIAFKSMGPKSAMAMGDLVLLESEVTPVMRALQAGGVEQTALHNHVLDETPRVMYMHVSAHGDPVKIAQTIRTALGATKTPLGAPGPPAAIAWWPFAASAGRRCPPTKPSAPVTRTRMGGFSAGREGTDS